MGRSVGKFDTALEREVNAVKIVFPILTSRMDFTPDPADSKPERVNLYLEVTLLNLGQALEYQQFKIQKDILMTDSAPEITSLHPHLEQLKAWQSWGYGMFISFGLSTFLAEEHPSGEHPSSVYAPDQLDVDQWIQVARGAGMKYAVLVTKHASGHCLWPSKQTDYHVGSSGNQTDVVAAFVRACAKYDIRPGLYYCSMDNYHTFGSLTPTDLGWDGAYFTTREYQEFQTAQLEELLTGYGRIAEV